MIKTKAKATRVPPTDLEDGDLLALTESITVTVDMKLAAKTDDRVLVFVHGWRYPLAIDKHGEDVVVYRES